MIVAFNSFMSQNRSTVRILIKPLGYKHKNSDKEETIVLLWTMFYEQI